MAYSLFTEGSTTNVQYVINKYNTHKYDEDHILVTTDLGNWIVLNQKEFGLLSKDKLLDDLNLFAILEDKGIVVTQNNIERLSMMFRERFHYLFNGINLHIIVPTLRCNLSCTYCQASSRHMDEKGYDMDKKTAKSVVDFIFQSPSKFLTIEFQGGEPLVNFPIIKYIVEYAKKKNHSIIPNENGWFVGYKSVNFTLVSNFTLMNDEIFKFIQENYITLNTSLDGPKKLHDKNRRFLNGGGSYKAVTYWIDRIKVSNYKFFSIAMPTITKYSLKYPKEIINEYLKHNFTNIRMRPLNIAGMAIKTWEKIGYSAEDFLDLWKKYMDYLIALNKDGIEMKDDDTIFILRRIITLRPPFNACLGSPCGACTIQTAYNQAGDIYTCDEARSNEIFKLGNVKKNNYKEVFTSPDALNFIGLTSFLSSYCDRCVWHPYCSPCLVSSYGMQNNLIPKIPFDFLCKIRGGQMDYIFKKLLFSKKEKNILLNWLKSSTI